MGINNLNKFLRNNCPEIFTEIHISEYAFKKVAVDISIYLCKFKTICGDDWLTAFINLIASFRRNEIHCVMIYDGGAPPEKDNERRERAAKRVKQEEKVCKLEDALEQFYITRIIDQSLIDLYNRRKNRRSKPKRLLSKNDETINMDLVEEYIKKMRSQILHIDPEDYNITKKLFDVLKVPYLQAHMEAETLCSDLCKRGLVDAVISEDTDVLAYGSPIFLSKINSMTDTCIRIDYEKMLEALKLKSDTFLDLCIMCGTDYNKNIFRVGPEKAYKYLQKFDTIENIEENTKLDTSILNHVRGRELFRDYKQEDVKILFCGVPDFNQLQEFILKHNIRSNIDVLKKCFIHSNVIVFEEEEDEKDENNEEGEILIIVEKK